VKLLWDFARINDTQVLSGQSLLTRAGLLRRNIGIRCPNCGAEYRVIQTRIRLAFALTWTVLLGTAAYLEDWSSHHVSVFQQRPLSVLMVLVLAFFIFLLLRIYTPLLASVRPSRDGEQLAFPLDSARRP
jgi:hypothetical protein